MPAAFGMEQGVKGKSLMEEEAVKGMGCVVSDGVTDARVVSLQNGAVREGGKHLGDYRICLGTEEELRIAYKLINI